MPTPEQYKKQWKELKKREKERIEFKEGRADPVYYEISDYDILMKQDKIKKKLMIGYGLIEETWVEKMDRESEEMINNESVN